MIPAAVNLICHKKQQGTPRGSSYSFSGSEAQDISKHSMKLSDVK